jgi:nicotinamidase-related amidase
LKPRRTVRIGFADNSANAENSADCSVPSVKFSETYERSFVCTLLFTVKAIRTTNDIENRNGFHRAKNDYPYFFPTDSGWKFNGPLETDEVQTQMFARSGRLSLDGWLERFKPYIEDGKTVVVSPHRVFGPQTNDLVLQLRKRRIGKAILGGMLANMCVESHLRDLLEQGFEVVVAKDATAGPRHPEWGYGYTAALINFAFLAHAVLTTDEVVKAMK